MADHFVFYLFDGQVGSIVAAIATAHGATTSAHPQPWGGVDRNPLYEELRVELGLLAEAELEVR